MSRLANGKMTTRQAPVGAASRTPIGRGAAGRVGGKPASAPSRKSALFGHQDARSFAIFTVVGIAALAMVAAVWLAVHRMTRPEVAQASPPPSAGDGTAAVQTNTYWQESFGVFRHYTIDPKTGRMVDAGRVSVDEMMEQGIEVPGYMRNNSPSISKSDDELALRFKAIRDHLNND